ncbi:MAG: transposase family protein [Rhizobium sp.]|jgi:hypothetical protein|nr:transposase family protein [Rhizobium sp.]
MGSAADKNFLDLILPQGILEYFLLTDFTSSTSEISLYLEEKNMIPEEYGSDKLISKGFFDEITVQDFPLRGKAVYLHIRRRRWLNQTTGTVVFRDWNMVAQGTRMTTEFASFFKAISGYQAGKL